MAIVRGGLFGLDANGQYGKTLGYQRLRGKNIVTRYHKPGGKPSELQTEKRRIAKIIMDAAKVAIGLDVYVPPKWQESMRYLRIQNTFYGEVLRQSLLLSRVITHGENLLLDKVKMIKGKHVEWATPIAAQAVHPIIPFSVLTVNQGAPPNNIWMLVIRGINPATMTRQDCTFRFNPKLDSTCDRMLYFVRAGNMPAIGMLPTLLL